MFVYAREWEMFEELYRRFKRGVEAGDILREYRRKLRFIPRHELRRERRPLVHLHIVSTLQVEHEAGGIASDVKREVEGDGGPRNDASATECFG